MIGLKFAPLVLGSLLLLACKGEASRNAAESASAEARNRAQVHVPAADTGSTPTCAAFVEHMGALIDATGHPNPHFNASMRPSAIAACERSHSLEANAAEARCVMRATDPEQLGDCGNGRFMQAW